MKRLALALLILLFPLEVFAVRLKDLMEVEGVRGNYLVGYGVVVGLKGTGDG
ncbi:MAG: flagellar basal body P-ring protein FlgI, partial [Thermodesulfobacterium sp.]|nr:flagellar basal body P-ring protein FlgI [Thermodesulfobacterium sp.]